MTDAIEPEGESPLNLSAKDLEDLEKIWAGGNQLQENDDNFWEKIRGLILDMIKITGSGIDGIEEVNAFILIAETETATGYRYPVFHRGSTAMLQGMLKILRQQLDLNVYPAGDDE